KAGIAKRGAPILTQKYAAEMLQVIGDHAAATGVQHFPRGGEWDAAIYEGQLHYRDKAGKLNLPLPALVGAHQADNAALAIAMLRHQNALTISDAALKAAMGWAQWPGRMHFLIAGPVTHLLPGDAEVWVDGGHNVSAGLALAKYFADYEAGSIDLVIGMLSNKDPAALVAPLKEKLACLTVIPVPGHESHGVADFPEVDAPMKEASDISAALGSLALGPGKTVLIAGSLYLAGEVLRANEQIPD
ncbi:MAG: bifunctional folylpolyglutamate synthase/dihydrofolate synthase, partial [Parasphingorhabdus sp.]